MKGRSNAFVCMDGKKRGEGLSRRDVLVGLGAAATELAVEGCRTDKTDGSKDKTPEEPFEAGNAFFDSNPDFLRPVTAKNGEYTKEQRKERKKILKNGEVIFEDVGLTFYLVKKGDTISEIREKLGKYPEYAYLRNQTLKLESFNIPAKRLLADLWIPIPTENADRYLTEGQFSQYAGYVINDMLVHPEYGDELEEILTKVSPRELIATFMAIAKQEGGDRPLGQFELHRWEPRYSAFSFSYFHILMKGPGLTARRKLNLTEGQLYHPVNAVKLLIGFLVEKSKESLKKPVRFFPLPQHYEDFAKFYNGSSWKKTNPHYVTNVRRYYEDAEKQVADDDGHWHALK